jgi:hypothetical protein
LAVYYLSTGKYLEWRMRWAIRTVGWIFIDLAAVLGFLDILTWPPGGLMFALPYIFLLPGGVFALIGTVLLALGRPLTHIEILALSQPMPRIAGFTSNHLDACTAPQLPFSR